MVIAFQKVIIFSLKCKKRNQDSKVKNKTTKICNKNTQKNKITNTSIWEKKECPNKEKKTNLKEIDDKKRIDAALSAQET